MPSANHNNSFLRTVTSLTLLGGIAASFAWACVSSSSDNKGTGGAAGTTGGSTSMDTNVGGAAGTANTSAGGSTSAAGHAGTGGAPAAPCNLTGAIAGGSNRTCAPAAPVFGTCTAASNGYFGSAPPVLSGGFSQWPAESFNTAAAYTGDVCHVTQSFAAASATAGWISGVNTYFQQDPDAGTGCFIVDASTYTGLTIDIKAAAGSIPDGALSIGVNFANANGARTKLTITSDDTFHTYTVPWSKLQLDTACGTVDPSTITTIFVTTNWYGDVTSRTVDYYFDNLGFY